MARTPSAPPRTPAQVRADREVAGGALELVEKAAELVGRLTSARTRTNAAHRLDLVAIALRYVVENSGEEAERIAARQVPRSERPGR